MYGVWATMSLKSERLLVTPFNMLPIERKHFPELASPDEIRQEQEKIWNTIVNRPNYELEHDEDAIGLVDIAVNPKCDGADACPDLRIDPRYDY